MATDTPAAVGDVTLGRCPTCARRDVALSRTAEGAGVPDEPGGLAGCWPLPAGEAAEAARPLSSWAILAGFVAVAAVGAVVPAPAAAAVFLLFAGAVTIRHPANGLTVLLLAVPFLLGEPKTPYFWLEPILVVLVLLSFLGHRLLGRVGFVPFHAAAVAAFVAAAVVALPLNLRDLLEDLWLFSSLNWSLVWAQGVPDISHLKYVDRTLVVVLGAGCFLVAAQPRMAAAVVGALPPLGVVVAVVSAFGLLRFFDVIQPSGQYLTLSFWTWARPERRLTAIAWNPDYLALFLVLVLPLLVAGILGPFPAWQRRVAAVAAMLGGLALAFTAQRAAYLAMLVALGVLAGLIARTAAGRVPWWPLLAAVAAVLAAIALLDGLVLGGRVAGRLARFGEDPNRLRLWETALRMALDQPLLGVGTGRYAFFFHEYARELREGFGPFWGTAHSLYLHLLAEQGVLGLASFALLFGSVWLGTLRRLWRLSGPRAILVAGLVAALTGWLVYGVVQFTFRVSALVYLACILAGTAVALAPPGRRPAWRPRRVLAAAAVGLVLLGWRAEAALRRPVSPGYEAGFYRWERQPDGGAARWTRHRAAMTVQIHGRVMELRFRAPIRDVAARPQTVRVWIDRRPSAVLHLAAPDWQKVDVPMGQPPGGHTLVEVEVGYTFVPSRVSASRDARRLGVMMGEIRWPDA